MIVSAKAAKEDSTSFLYRKENPHRWAWTKERLVFVLAGMAKEDDEFLWKEAYSRALVLQAVKERYQRMPRRKLLSDLERAKKGYPEALASVLGDLGCADVEKKRGERKCAG